MSGGAYYNEHDPFAAVAQAYKGWFRQCHWFGGIGGWSYALRLVGWEDSRECWTGSCPCQPFSAAGGRKGFADERHLWPAWFHLIGECSPAIVFGEQVARATEWLGLVHSDLEALGYAVGAMPIEAASAGADHLRDRYWFVAHHDIERQGDGYLQPGRQLCRTGGHPQDHLRPLEHAPSLGWGEGWTEHELRGRGISATVASVEGSQYIECSDGKWRRFPPPRVRWLGTRIPSRVDLMRGFGNAIDPRPAAEFIRACM